VNVSTEFIMTGLFVFALAGFLGFETIRRVPRLLHTPLMALTNALSAISLVGSIVVLGGQYSTYSTILGFIAVIASMINVVGGFLITDKMLKMFKPREKKKPEPAEAEAGA
jgi:NAD(P) transhydrogenase subunit alpha